MATKKKETELVINDDTEAIVTERTAPNGNTTVEKKYTAKVIQNEVIEEDQNELDNDESNDEIFNHHQYGQIEEIPKDKISEFFEVVTNTLPNEHDNFFIKVLRTPDGFDDDFNRRCNDQIPLGLFGCRLADEFRITELLQKRNANSGGRFTFIAYDKNQKPMQRYVGYILERGQRVAQTSSIVMQNIFIPNPFTENLPSNSQTDLAQILKAFQESSRDQTNLLLEAIRNNNQPKEKTTIEKAIEQKIINDIANPQAQSGNNFEERMMSIFMMPQMAEKMANKMFPDAPVTPVTENEAWWQTAMKTPEIVDLAKSVGLTAFNGINQLMLAKQLTEQQKSAPQPQQQNVTQAPAMQLPQAENPLLYNQSEPEQEQMMFDEETMKLYGELTDKILSELKTDNPIDNNNKVFQELTKDYPQAYPMMKMLVGNPSMTFDKTLEMLEEFADFEALGLLDDDGDFNESGLYVKKRLKEFYEFLRK